MSGSNNTARKVNTNTLIADIKALLTNSTSYNQGDFLIIDPSTHLIALPAAESDGADFAGVAPTTVVLGRPPSGYVTDTDASIGIPSTPGPTYGDEFLCTAKSGQSFAPGVPVYVDPATTSPLGSKNGVANTGSHAIGIYTGDRGTVTGDGKLQITCKLGVRYPDDTLHI